MEDIEDIGRFYRKEEEEKVGRGRKNITKIRMEKYEGGVWGGDGRG